jgi:hypothetical protein
MSNWDDEDFEPTIPVAAPVLVDQWEGEDEEEEVKDSWEDFGSEEKKVSHITIPISGVHCA